MSSATAGEPLIDRLGAARSSVTHDPRLDTPAGVDRPQVIALDLDDTPPSASWLAAYAMGLVASEEHFDVVGELVSCLPRDAATVRGAIARLADPRGGDAGLRRRARALLEAARARVAGTAGRT